MGEDKSKYSFTRKALALSAVPVVPFVTGKAHAPTLTAELVTLFVDSVSFGFSNIKARAFASYLAGKLNPGALTGRRVLDGCLPCGDGWGMRSLGSSRAPRPVPSQVTRVATSTRFVLKPRALGVGSLLQAHCECASAPQSQITTYKS